jgi:putative PIG3 family NAD(P)H quinone oxidoreductase
MMKIIEITGQIPHRKLALSEANLPAIKDDEVLVKIEAAGVNRADLFQVEGSYPSIDSASEIPGLEVSGTIVELGKMALGWQIGDRICALLPGGGYAEYVQVPASMLLPVPENLVFDEAASLPEAIYTAYFNLVVKAQLQRGEKLLIHGGASGVGAMALQLAKLLGAYVITTASSDEKCVFCQKLGADEVVNYHQQSLNSKVDVILDMFGGEFFNKNISLLNYNGRLASIALLKGNKAEVNLGAILLKNLTIFGSTLRSRSLKEKEDLTRQIKADIWPSVIDGQIRPVIDKAFPLEEVQQAHDYMRENKHLGKIVLQVNNN